MLKSIDVWDGKHVKFKQRYFCQTSSDEQVESITNSSDEESLSDTEYSDLLASHDPWNFISANIEASFSNKFNKLVDNFIEKGDEEEKVHLRAYNALAYRRQLIKVPPLFLKWMRRVNVNVNVIIRSPRGFSGIISNTFRGLLARLLIAQFTISWVINAPWYECEMIWTLGVVTARVLLRQ